MGFGSDVPPQFLVDAREQTVDEAVGNPLGGVLLTHLSTKGLKTGKWRVSDNGICLAIEQSGSCSHAAAPDNHLVPLASQELTDGGSLLGFPDPQADCICFHVDATAHEVEAGDCKLGRQVLD